MKLTLNKLAILGVGCMAALSSASLLQSCDDDEALKSVDLRYRVEDAYVLPCKGAVEELSIKFQVKSTDPWEVFGENKKEWYAISPANGDAGQTYDVVIKCKENTELDDRVETVHIKSDYWTGKKFTLTQKGTAFLNFEEPEMLDKGAERTVPLKVLANQKWSAKVLEGQDWLSIEGANSGELNGQVMLKAEPNSGAMRYAKVALLDRYDVQQQIVDITQDGVKLEPVQPVNAKWYELDAEGGKLTIHVASNSRWGVEKSSPEDETWYDFEQTEFNGDGDLVINFGTHDQNSSVRAGEIIFSSISDEPGVKPVTTTIRIKQASTEGARTTVNEVNITVNGDKYLGSKLMPGRYNVHIGPFGGDLNMFFMINAKPWTEFRWHVKDGKSQLSTTPWSGEVHDGAAQTEKTLNIKEDNVLSWDIKSKTSDKGEEFIHVDWYLNGEFIKGATADGKKGWKLPASILDLGGQLLIRGKNLPVHKWEYIEPLKWGE